MKLLEFSRWITLSLPVLASSVLALSCADARSEDAWNIGVNNLSFEDFEAMTYREPDTGVYIVDGDTPVANREALLVFYERYVQSGALIVNQIAGFDDRWSDAQKLSLTYCVSTSFGANYTSVVQATQSAALAWETAANVDFIHVSAHDNACNSNNANVMFDISPTSGQPYLARAFFPNYPRAIRNVLIDASSFGSIAPYTLAGIMRHELGHALGFRHEHTRPEAASCFEDYNWRALTGYDSASVMHYPYCNGINSGDLVITQLDKDGAASLYGSPPVSNSGYWTSRYSDADGWTGAEYYWGTIKYPDLNGDGKQDVCGRAIAGLYCALSNGSSFNPPSHWTNGYADSGGWTGAKHYWGTIKHPDLNGDGKQDVCGRGGAGLACALSNGSSFNPPFYWTSGYSDASGWAGGEHYWGTIAYPDLNGDGKQDVCGRTVGGLYCALSNGSSFSAPSYWTSGYSDAGGWAGAKHYWGTIKYIDLNGDGKQDVCGRGVGGLYCALSNGSSFNLPSYWTSGYADSGGWTGAAHYWETIEYPDLNGDGKQDVCGRGVGGLYCALSNGSSFNPPSLWASGYADSGGWTGAEHYWRTIRYPDLNGDGKQDVCGRAIAGLFCALSNGSSYDPPSFWTSSYSDAGGWTGAKHYWGTIEYPDLDGDGKQDVCGRAAAGIYCEN